MGGGAGAAPGVSGIHMGWTEVGTSPWVGPGPERSPCSAMVGVGDSRAVLLVLQRQASSQGKSGPLPILQS